MFTARIAMAALGTGISLFITVFGSPTVAASTLQQDSVTSGFYVPSYYPAPYGGWVQDWRDAYDAARGLVASMTLAEKTNITAGSGLFMGSAYRLGFPQLCFQDGPSGIRQADNVTVFPPGITVGATFDKKLMYERAVAIGKEARGKGVHVWLGPAVGPLGRKPKGGRNWEGFGADPCLQAVGARETIKGVQSQGVIAALKHFVGNEQEMHRMYQPLAAAYSSNIDDRVLHEVYMWPFAEGIRAGAGSVMMAYNAVNGTACSQHPYLINRLLKDELGFQGFIQSDWLGQISGVASALAGLDMAMPGDTQIPLVGSSYWMYQLSRAVLNGSVPMDRLNDMATRIVAAWYKMGQDQNFPETNFDTNTKSRVGLRYPAAFPLSPVEVVNHFTPVQADHNQIARKIAQDAITLLKNVDNLLPLRTNQSIKVFGTGAERNPDGPNACRDRNCNKGTLGQGWGSGTVDYMYLDDPITGIRSKAKDVEFFNTDIYPRVLKARKSQDIAIVFITSDAGENTYTVEGNHGDRDASGLYAWHGGDKLVADAAKMFDNVVVVAHTVGPLLLDKWIKLPSVKSVLFAHLPGQEAGTSLAEVIFGDVSPSGHLPYTITNREKDMPDSVTQLVAGEFLGQPQDVYSEGLYVDYRALKSKKPLYAFGHGLSYTTFSLDDAVIEKVTQMTERPPNRVPKTGILNYTQPTPPYTEAVAPKGFLKFPRYLYSWLSESDAKEAVADATAGKRYPYPDGYSTTQRPGPPAGGGEGGNPALWDVAYKISLTVKNVGSNYPGKAVVQAYVEKVGGDKYDVPPLQLRDFAKTESIEAGKKASVELQLTRKDLSVWDVELQDWVIPVIDGSSSVTLGVASDDLWIRCTFDDLQCRSIKDKIE